EITREFFEWMFPRPQAARYEGPPTSDFLWTTPFGVSHGVSFAYCGHLDVRAPTTIPTQLAVIMQEPPLRRRTAARHFAEDGAACADAVEQLPVPGRVRPVDPPG